MSQPVAKISNLRLVPAFTNPHQCRYTALLSVKNRSRLRPYAWLDNLRPNNTINVHKIVHFQPLNLTEEQFQAVIFSLCNRTDLAGLNEHLQDLTRAMWTSRSERLSKEGRRYPSTNYADQDAAWMQRPKYATPASWLKAKAEALGQEPELLPVDKEGTPVLPEFTKPKKPPVWTWDDYVEHPELMLMLRQTVARNIPRAFLQHEPFKDAGKLAQMHHEAIQRFRRDAKDGGPNHNRLVSGKSRISYLQYLAGNLVQGHRILPVMVPAPFPLANLSPLKIAQRSQEDQAHLYAQCQSWLSFCYVVDQACEASGAAAPRSTFRHPELIPFCSWYKAQGLEVVPTDPMVYDPFSTTEVPELCDQFGCVFKRP